MNDDALLAALGERISSLAAELIDIRRDLHAHPELSGEETRTTEAVARRLDAAGVRVRLLPGTGLLADDRRERRRPPGGACAPTWTPSPCASAPASTSPRRPTGVCHACGHDVHVIALVGALLALKECEPALVERGIAVRGIFQAAEEIMPGGAHDAITAGALDGVDACSRSTATRRLDVGEVGLREGPIDRGVRPGHGLAARPRRAHLAAAAHRGPHLSRWPRSSPTSRRRCRADSTRAPAPPWSGGRSAPGGRRNVIPSTGECQGTLRMLDAHAWLTVGPLLEEIVHGVVQPYGVQAKVERVKGVPPVVNTAAGIEVFRLASLAGGMHPVPTVAVARRRGLLLVPLARDRCDGSPRHPHPRRAHLRPAPGRPRRRRGLHHPRRPAARVAWPCCRPAAPAVDVHPGGSMTEPAVELDWEPCAPRRSG